MLDEKVTSRLRSLVALSASGAETEQDALAIEQQGDRERERNLKEGVIELWVTTTAIRLYADRKGNIGNGVNIAYFIRNNLVEKDWNNRFRIWEVTRNYTAYDKAHGQALLPRNVFGALYKYIKQINPTVRIVRKKLPCVTPIDVKMKLKQKIVPRDHQLPLINFLNKDHEGNSGCHFKPLSASCGSGKTFCTIYSLVHSGHPSLIVLGFLIDQWYKSILQFTTIPKDKIYVVQGYDTLAKLIEMGKNGYRPAIVIFSTRTLVLYAIEKSGMYSTLDDYATFQKLFGFGTLVHDETHLQFYANSQIDLVSNIREVIFLSATYMRSDFYGQKVFSSIFPEKLIFGGSKTKRYTTVYMVGYGLEFPTNMDKYFMVPKGYAHSKYENYLMSHTSYLTIFLEKVLTPLIWQYFLNVKKTKQKCLVLCRTRDFVNCIADNLRHYLASQHLNIKSYFAGDKEHGSTKNLEADIIISTSKSCSTGIDIKGLKTLINTVSFASEPQAIQTMGRLREIPGDETIFVDLWNAQVSAHHSHKVKRSSAYRSRALHYSENRINY